MELNLALVLLLLLGCVSVSVQGHASDLREFRSLLASGTSRNFNFLYCSLGHPEMRDQGPGLREERGELCAEELRPERD